jgi:hypothetical protein
VAVAQSKFRNSSAPTQPHLNFTPSQGSATLASVEVEFN